VSARLLAAYLAVFGISAALAVTSFAIGSDTHAQPDVSGTYRGTGTCVGGVGRFKLEQSGQFVDASGVLDGKLRLRDGRLTGTVSCLRGAERRFCMRVADVQRLRPAVSRPRPGSSRRCRNRAPPRSPPSHRTTR
jgi:hypothetical protein